MAWAKTSRHARGYGKAHDAMRAHLMATVILCEECTRNNRVAPGTIADHIKPLADGGDASRSNYQLLCKPCSDAKTIRDKGQRQRVRGACGVDGLPTDPSHPWNRP
ncbi:HNH endonuclease [Sphingomonas sanguinis]|uniref:HNH endonuclease signature motif containing protein n=1 Tax=Sphingomonas sp. LC-1 TaxID=3110957 RepID=UPI0021BB5192|nr:HNH endonuclease signature motif containing protein [Sphingomonas sp. LC-1]MCT8003288.1 HNH endonuclease [Sphingomonas sp. LC-1]